MDGTFKYNLILEKFWEPFHPRIHGLMRHLGTVRHTKCKNDCTTRYEWIFLRPCNIMCITVTLFKVSNVFLRGLLSLIGTSDINSTPPAIAVSHWPLAIRPTAVTENSTFYNEKCIPKCTMEVDRQRKYCLDFEKILLLQFCFSRGFISIFSR